MRRGFTNDGSTHFPARFWLQHWGSHAGARSYARITSGIEISPGDIRVAFDGETVEARLDIDGTSVVKAHARVGCERLGTGSGYSIYYTQRSSPAGGQEVAQLRVPWISDAYLADEGEVAFSFAADHSVLELVKNGPQVVSSVTYRRMTLTSCLAHRVVDAFDK